MSIAKDIDQKDIDHTEIPGVNFRASIRPDVEYIRKYYKEHKIKKMEGFIGFGKPFSEAVPIKTSPAWCPKKKG